MIGCDERAVPGTAAPEHRQTEHDRYLATACQFSQIKFVGSQPSPLTRPANVSVVDLAVKQRQAGNRSAESGGMPDFRAARQRQNPFFLAGIVKGSKPANFIEPAQTIQTVEVMGVARGQLGRFQITSAEVSITKCFGTLAREKVKAQPAAVDRK